MSRIIIKNLPKDISESDLKEHFSIKGNVTDCKIITTKAGKSRLFAFIGYKTEKQAKESIKYYNNSYLKTSKIQVEEASPQGEELKSRPWSKHSKVNQDKDKNNKKESDKVNIKKEKTERLKEIENIKSEKHQFDVLQGLVDEKTSHNQVKDDEEKKEDLGEYDSKRLYLRNLSFQITEEELRETFSKYGKLTEVSIPRDKNKNSFGYGFVSYETMESAIAALEIMDKKVYQGRILHINPAKAKDIKASISLSKIEHKDAKSSFKKRKYQILKEEYDKQVNWNYLFLNSNTVIDAIAHETKVDKKDILSNSESDLAVKISTMETVVINKTKAWLESLGVDLSLFNKKRLSCERSKTMILIKNLSFSTNEDELKRLFERYGDIIQFHISPLNVMGIVEFYDEKNAENCLKNLSFFEINDSPLYLEYAPIGLVGKGKKEDLFKKEGIFEKGNVIFVRNLNFETTEAALTKEFEEFNPLAVKIVKTKDKKGLSAGYGFIELKNDGVADKVLKLKHGLIIDGYSVKLEKAKGKETSNDEKNMIMLGMKREKESELAGLELDEDLKETVDQNKLLIKNIAFEANLDELRSLIRQFGDVKTVRLPKQITGQHRGYAFVEFISNEEAKTAFDKLSHTHFYGRKLVIEWAKKDKNIDEIREETQRKVNLSKIKSHSKKEKGTLKNK